MSADIRISVALVTRNRPASLRRCLTSLRAQNAQPSEIIISDDSDEVSAGLALATEFGARHLVGPRRGLYANRNAAALACTGTHIRTMDDDHTFPEGHMDACLAAVRGDPKAIWTTGETSYVDGQLYGTAPTASQLHPSGLGGPVANVDDNWAIADGSTIFPASVFARGYRMVEDFAFGSSYLEFGAFLYRRGYRSCCMSGIVVEHHANLETLQRGRSPAVVASWMFASLCFNLHFQPHRARTAKYALANFLHSKTRWDLLAALPGMIAKAKQRWTTDG
jgi:glycosyltransferase involved in cell wall biosynthesis